jgi:hypothetical protein
MTLRKLHATDAEIDRMVYGLYGLTAGEIALVEGASPPLKQDECTILRMRALGTQSRRFPWMACHSLHDTTPNSGCGGSGSMEMYSRKFPSGSSKNTDAAGIQAKTIGSSIGDGPPGERRLGIVAFSPLPSRAGFEWRYRK